MAPVKPTGLNTASEPKSTTWMIMESWETLYSLGATLTTTKELDISMLPTLPTIFVALWLMLLKELHMPWGLMSMQTESLFTIGSLKNVKLIRSNCGSFLDLILLTHLCRKENFSGLLTLKELKDGTTLECQQSEVFLEEDLELKLWLNLCWPKDLQ